MIEMDNITKSFDLMGKTVQVLKGISLSINEGEFVSIMGPSGSGKSTLSSILGCLATPSTGTYKILEQDVTQLSSNQLAIIRNQKIGFIFQEFHLLEGISALDNVMLPLFYCGIKKKMAIEKAKECLQAVGLEHKINHRPAQLSGGQKQRVAVARALVNDPSFLFADEPTGALDQKTGHEIMGLLQKLNMAGHTIIQVTHSLTHCKYTGRILHLVDGNIIKDEMVEQPILASNTFQDTSKQQMIRHLWSISRKAEFYTPEVLAATQELAEQSTDISDNLVASGQFFVHSPYPEAFAYLKKLFTHQDWVIRAEVLKLLQQKNHENHLELFSKGIDDDNAWVRFLSITGLKKYSYQQFPPDLIEKILKALTDEDARIRATVLLFVSRWQRIEYLEHLKQSSLDPDGRVRANALEGLTYFLDARPELYQFLEKFTEDPNNRARGNVLLALAKNEASLASVLEKLNAMLISNHNLMRGTASWCLGRIQNKFCGEILLAQLRIENEQTVITQIIASLALLSKTSFPFAEQLKKGLVDLQ